MRSVSHFLSTQSWRELETYDIITGRSKGDNVVAHDECGPDRGSNPMKIACPHCGRQGSLPDGSALPTMVKCPECKNKFQPASMSEFVAVAAAEADTKRCPFCSEQIQSAAKKCRHCGEILDVALRAAEEDRSLARSRQEPVIVNNNVSTSYSASAVAYAGHHRKSLLRSFLRFIFVCFVALIEGAIVAGTGHPQLGTGLSVVGALMMIIGVPIYAVRFLIRMFFG